MDKSIKWDTREWGGSLCVDENCMELKVCFFSRPQAGWDDGERQLWQELGNRKIRFGVQEDSIRDFFAAPRVGVVFTAARGEAPEDGEDDRIEYFFAQGGAGHPARRSDGSVDFYDLNLIQGCGRGDLLARLHQGRPDRKGMDIYGRPVAGRPGKRLVLQPGKGCLVSEDGRELLAGEDGHIVVRDGSVCVSPVCRINNVDLSTGNISFGGSVEIQGNVSSNFSVKSGGDVIIWGSVEAAHIEAQGNIIIRGGMNGMGRGSLQAGGNILARFLEGVSAGAHGSIYSGAILYCNIMCAGHVEADGKKGAIVGGRIRADRGIRARYLGSVMAPPTILEAGGADEHRKEYKELADKERSLAKDEEELRRTIQSLAAKLQSGQKFSQGQLDLIKKLVAGKEECGRKREACRRQMEEVEKSLEAKRASSVEVRDTAYPGVVIVVDGATLRIVSEHRFCRFRKEAGEVVGVSL